MRRGSHQPLHHHQYAADNTSGNDDSAAASSTHHSADSNGYSDPLHRDDPEEERARNRSDPLLPLQPPPLPERNAIGTPFHSNSGGSRTISTGSVNSSSYFAVPPGRSRRKRPPAGLVSPVSSAGKKKKRKGFCYRFYAYWVRGTVRTFSSLLAAVLVWYALGVISIGTSKTLLSHREHHHVDRRDGSRRSRDVGGVPPLFLTLQQLLIGSTLLRFLVEVRLLGGPGIQPWPTAGSSSSSAASERRRSGSTNSYGGAKNSHFRQQQQLQRRQQQLKRSFEFVMSDYHPYLILTAAYFACGFLATNYGFASSPASYVETIKASEPVTSAAIAVLWGIEVLSKREVLSLAVIVTGVLLSTLGNQGDSSTTAAAAATDGQPPSVSTSSPFSDSILACLVVMASNLCFSFRGLYQKLLRATPEGSPQALDDLNLQYRMQQIGVVLLAVPVLIFELPSIVRSLWHITTEHGIITTGIAWRYIGLSLVNGVAFTCYNLASTYILSRISVVHHAALNCIRRIFAIIVTSIIFSVPVTPLGVFGIVFSFAGFMAFSHYKVQRQTQPKPLSSLLPISAAK